MRGSGSMSCRTSTASTEPLTGQRLVDLAPLVDWVAPMLYHNILLQAAELDRVCARRLRHDGRAEGAARRTSRFQSRPRRHRRLGPSDVGRRLESRAGRGRGAAGYRGTGRLSRCRLAGIEGRGAAGNGQSLAMTNDGPGAHDALLRAEAINKTFGAVVALQDVGLQIPRGDITGLVGDNGAGKSTLIKIISGVLTPDSGVIAFEGKAAKFASPADARAQGIETVYQDLALVGNLSVWANLYLGRELTIGPKFLHILDKPAMHASTERHAQAFRPRRPADRRVDRIAVRRPAAGRRDRPRRRLGLEAHPDGRADGGARRRRDQGGRGRDFRAQEAADSPSW